MSKSVAEYLYPMMYQQPVGRSPSAIDMVDKLVEAEIDAKAVANATARAQAKAPHLQGAKSGMKSYIDSISNDVAPIEQDAYDVVTGRSRSTPEYQLSKQNLANRIRAINEFERKPTEVDTQALADLLSVMYNKPQYSKLGYSAQTPEQILATRLVGQDKIKDDLSQMSSVIDRGLGLQLKNKQIYKMGYNKENSVNNSSIPPNKGSGGGFDLKTAIKQNEEIGDREAKAKLVAAKQSLISLGQLIPNAFDPNDSTPIPGLDYEWRLTGPNKNLIPDDLSLVGESATAKQLAADFEKLIIPFRSEEFGATLSPKEAQSFNTAIGKTNEAIIDGNATKIRAALATFRSLALAKLKQLEDARPLGSQYYQSQKGGKSRSQEFEEAVPLGTKQVQPPSTPKNLDDEIMRKYGTKAK